MNLKFISLIRYVFIIGLFLNSCSPGQTLEPTFTTSPTITATVIPTQTDTPTPEPTKTPEPTPTPSLLQGQLSGLAAAPDLIVDSAGLHITLPDSSRVIDIETADVAKEIVFDSEYSLYKIYDANGNITAEYDPGQGKIGDADYVPATGWVDVQKLAKNLFCSKGTGLSCMSKDYEDANSIWFEFGPTGILRYKEIIDDSTGKSLGRVLLSGAASRDKNQNSIVAWVVVQAEDYSDPGINKYGAAALLNLTHRGGKSADAVNIFPIEQWQKWMTKGSTYAYGCLESGQSYSDYITNKTDESAKTDVVEFLSSSGTAKPLTDVVLVPVSVSLTTPLP